MPDPISISPRRVLLACYSLDGHTRRLALELARHCQADIETIGDTVQRQSAVGRLRSALEAFLHLQPKLRASRCAPRDYALVVVCTPVWAWNMASPVRSWLYRHRAEMRQVALLCTYGGSGQEKVLQDLQLLCGRAPVARLAMSDDRIEQRTYARRLQAFGDRINGAVPLPSPATTARAA